MATAGTQLSPFMRWATPAAIAFPTGLAADWELTEASGNATDSFGSSTGVDTNTVTSAATPWGTTARKFTRANSEYFSVADNAALSTGNIDFAVEAWVKLDSAPPTGQTYAVVTKDAAGAGEYVLDVYDQISVVRFFVAGSGSCLVTGPSLIVGVWYHLIGYHDSVNDLVGIVVNAGAPTTATTGGVGPTDTATEFRIGSRAYVGDESYFDGQISTARLWKKVLNLTEINALYSKRRPITYAEIAAGQLSGTQVFPFVPLVEPAAPAGNRRRRVLIAGKR